MSDKIYRTVTYEIEPSGDCGKCNGLIKPVRYCMPFGLQLKAEIDWQYNSTYEQCQACKDYLESEKAKVGRVYCKQCFYFNGESCGKWNETKKDSDNQIYSKNCTDREE